MNIAISPSKKSSRSKQSLLTQQYFNPVRFLAMQLMQRNRERKDSEYFNCSRQDTEGSRPSNFKIEPLRDS